VSIATEHVWEIAPDFVQPSGEEVHVWRAALDVSSPYVERLSRILSDDERRRAARFHFERDRSRFIVTRAYLRILIGHYLQKAPSEIKFSYGPNGKPFLAGEGAVDLRFNLSHSHGLAVYAVTNGREIGVDLEYNSENMDIEAIAERFFSAQEIAALKSLPDHEKSKAFFACWTRKEAYIKAQGKGLSVLLNSFSVSLIPGKPAELLDVQSDPIESSRWSFLELVPDSHYVGALAVEGHDWRPIYWDFNLARFIRGTGTTSTDCRKSTHHGDTEFAELISTPPPRPPRLGGE
jgi:4'-phosphopantetheinyl transferase